jgi:hypothetical protein
MGVSWIDIFHPGARGGTMKKAEICSRAGQFLSAESTLIKDEREKNPTPPGLCIPLIKIAAGPVDSVTYLRARDSFDFVQR